MVFMVAHCKVGGGAKGGGCCRLVAGVGGDDIGDVDADIMR